MKDINEIFNKASSYMEEKKYDKAFFLFAKGADKGDSSCQLNLGYLYENGLGIKKDIIKALFWYEKSSELGDYAGLSNIGLIYKEKGDFISAKEWLQKAYKYGDIDALLEIAKIDINENKITESKQLLKLLITSSKEATEYSVQEAKKLLSTIEDGVSLQIQNKKDIKL